MTAFLDEQVTICGRAGEGKSTIARILKNGLPLEHFMSAGNFTRELAAEHKLDLAELERRAEEDYFWDMTIDRRTQEFGAANRSFVFEGRLAWFCIPRSFKVLFTCDEDVRLARISRRDGKAVDVVRTETMNREASMNRRYSKWYGLERFDDHRKFDLVIDTTEEKPDAIAARIVEALRSHQLVQA